jgi:hypothetical protein
VVFLGLLVDVRQQTALECNKGLEKNEEVAIADALVGLSGGLA